VQYDSQCSSKDSLFFLSSLSGCVSSKHSQTAPFHKRIDRLEYYKFGKQKTEQQRTILIGAAVHVISLLITPLTDVLTDRNIKQNYFLPTIKSNL
jgi:hypothetical protein